MSKVTIKLDSSGITELLRSTEIAAVCEKEAAKMTRATGVPYEPDVYVGRFRVNAGAYQKGSSADESVQE